MSTAMTPEPAAWLITWAACDKETRFTEREARALVKELDDNGWLNVRLWPLYMHPLRPTNSETGLCAVHQAQDCHSGCPYRTVQSAVPR